MERYSFEGIKVEEKHYSSAREWVRVDPATECLSLEERDIATTAAAYGLAAAEEHARRKNGMELDFRNDKDAAPELAKLDALSLNALFVYCKKRVIKMSDVTVIHFGDAKNSLQTKVGWATVIAGKFDAVIQLEHLGVPITVYPDTRSAAFADFEKREAAGERMPAEEGEEDDGD